MSDPLQSIMEERCRQDAQWGIQDHDDLYWYAVMSEEMGEVATALIEGTKEEQRAEIVQVAATALAWLEFIDRREPTC